MRFNQVRHSDVGSYQCLATNEYGADTSLLHVYVRDSSPTPHPQPPSQIVQIQPPTFSGNQGDAIVLNCRNTINVYATLVWTKTGYQTLPTHIDVTDGKLTIKNARVEDSGRYICTSSPTPGAQHPETVTDTVDVQILARPDDRGVYPSVKPLNDLYTVVQGKDFTLNCEVSGNPYPKVTWKKVHEDNLGSNVYANGHILKITSATPDNRGIYQCIADSNGLTSDASTIIDIERKF